MNEWETIAWAIIVGSAIFSGMWLLLQDFKKSAHKRIERCENVMDEIVRDSGKNRSEYITLKAFDRFEVNMNNRLDSMTGQITTTNSRMDDLVLALRNGGMKR